LSSREKDSAKISDCLGQFRRIAIMFGVADSQSVVAFRFRQIARFSRFAALSQETQRVRIGKRGPDENRYEQTHYSGNSNPHFFSLHSLLRLRR
jgi:hypothetical protein